VTFSLALFGLIYGLIRGNPDGWSSATVLVSLIGSAALLVAFVVVESRQTHAMLDLSLFRNPSFGGVSIVAFALSASMFAMFLYLTLYIQDILEFTPLEAGVRFLPITLISFFVAPVSARLAGRVPVRALLGGGLILVGIGLGLMHGIELGDSWTGLLPGFLISGGGIGMVNPTIASTAIGVVEPARAGMASGINTTFRQVGIATGVAGLGAIFSSKISSFLTAHLPQAPSSFADAVASGAARQGVQAAPPQFREHALVTANHAFIVAFNEILLIGAIIAAVGGVLGFLLVRPRDFVGPVGGHGAPEMEPDGA